MPNKKSFADTLQLIVICTIVFIFALWITAWLTGCKSPEKAIDYLKKKDALAGACVDNYPNKDSIAYVKGDTVREVNILPGDTLRYTDTIYSEVYGHTEYRYITKACPPSKIINNYIHDTVKTYTENTAKIYELNKELNEVTASRDKYKEKAGNWWKWLLIGIGTGVAGLIFFKSVFKAYTIV